MILYSLELVYTTFEMIQRLCGFVRCSYEILILTIYSHTLLILKLLLFSESSSLLEHNYRQEVICSFLVILSKMYHAYHGLDAAEVGKVNRNSKKNFQPICLLAFIQNPFRGEFI